MWQRNRKRTVGSIEDSATNETIELPIIFSRAPRIGKRIPIPPPSADDNYGERLLPTLREGFRGTVFLVATFETAKTATFPFTGRPRRMRGSPDKQPEMDSAGLMGGLG